MRRWVLGLGVGVAALYVAGGVFLTIIQRKLLFPAPFVPQVALDEAAQQFGCEAIRLTTSDGVSLYAWYRESRGERAVLFLHGNGESVADRPELIAQLHMAGWDVLVPAYRGYPGSEGSPSEEGLYKDARAAWDYLINERGFDPSDIVVHGKSMGGGVATGLVMDVHPAALVLESTFTSLTEVAGRVAWMYPVQWMMADRFDTAARASLLDLPVLLLHGTDDPLIPIEHARINLQRFPDADLVEVAAGHAETLTMLDAAARRAYMGLLTRVSSQSDGAEGDEPAL
ncbi:MAG: fermentation-respiration switch protein FrsA (DUF1100 family) [Myxococcota bacterium]